MSEQILVVARSRWLRLLVVAVALMVAIVMASALV